MWIRPEEHKKVGKLLAKARLAAGLSQAQLAALLGKPQSFVSSYESGQRRIDLLEFIRIVSALKARPAEVFQRVLKVALSRPR